MATAKVRVIVSLNGSGVFQVVAPIDPKYVRRLTDSELAELATEIPATIETVLGENQPPKIASKKK